MTEPAVEKPRWMYLHPLALLGLTCVLAGCPPDESPLRAEIDTLRKQLAKQESVIVSLQEGGKVMQQQIDLLSGELREAEQKTEALAADRKQLTAKVKSITAQSRKLSGQLKRARAKSAQAAKAFHVEDKKAQTRELLHPLPAASKAAEDALSRNGYTLRVRVMTDRHAVYVTDRKVSAPASLEVPGFRNQYVVALHALPSQGTLLSVKADFERTGQGNRILSSGPEERSEIERRLIAEIAKNLANSRKAKP